MPRIAVIATSLAAVLAAAAWASRPAAVRESAFVPLIGAGYTHFWNPDCSLDGTGIVEFGNGARTRIKRQLAAMRAAGIESLRLIMWNQHDPTGQTWGVVPSATGRLVEPYRSNFIAYLKDVRAAGFKQLTIAFGTQGPNSPLLYGPSGITDSGYDPSLFEENWRFIQDVRSLVKKYSGRAEDGDGVLHFGRHPVDPEHHPVRRRRAEGANDRCTAEERSRARARSGRSGTVAR